MTDLRPGGPHKTCSALDDPTIVGSFLKDLQLQDLKLPDVAALKSMYMKAMLYKNGGDHMSMIIYASMALWSYRASVPAEKLDDDTQSMFLALIREGRAKLTEQFKKKGEEDTDGAVFTPVLRHEMLDKILKQPMDFTTLSGMESEKVELKSQFLYPNMYPYLYYGDANNVLLYGPPGTGKTMIAKAVTNEFERISNKTLRMKMFIAAGSSLRSKWEGGTEKNISELFKASEETAKKVMEQDGKTKCKSLIFLDEVESLAKSRALDPQNVRSVTTLLQEIDGPKPLEHTLVMAATNLPWQLDTAFLRRFTSKIFVDVPDFSDRANLLMKFIVKKFLKFNKQIACEMCLVPDIEDEKFKAYLQFFESDEVKIDEFAPEIRDPLPSTKFQHLYNQEGKTYVKEFQQCLEAHKEDYAKECLRQLKFMGISGVDATYRDWFIKFSEDAKEKDGKERMKAQRLPLRTYIRLFAARVRDESGADGKHLPVEQPAAPAAPAASATGTKSVLSEFERICVLCHYIAEITGPHPALKVCGETADGRTPIATKKTSHLSNNYFGYSNSDMEKLVVYMFQELAQEIIRSKVVITPDCKLSKKTNCCDEHESTVRACMGVLSSGDGEKTYSELENRTGQDRLLLQRSGTNALVTIDSKNFQIALVKYATTTGELPTMFDFYCFQRSQSDEDPKCKETMMRRCRFLRDGTAPEEESDKTDAKNGAADKGK